MGNSFKIDQLLNNPFLDEKRIHKYINLFKLANIKLNKFPPKYFNSHFYEETLLFLITEDKELHIPDSDFFIEELTRQLIEVENNIIDILFNNIFRHTEINSDFYKKTSIEKIETLIKLSEIFDIEPEKQMFIKYSKDRDLVNLIESFYEIDEIDDYFEEEK